MVDAKSLWCEAAGYPVLRSEVLPPRSSGEVLVRTLFSGISRGTETTVFTGKVPETEYERMRAPHMSGTFPFPVKYGYSSVGKVEDGEGLEKGTTVFCLFPHQSHYVVSAEALVVVPAGLAADRAVLAANMETALNICWDAEIGIGNRVAVFGCGVVGLAVGYLASQVPGVECTLVDPDVSRSEPAERMGAAFCHPDQLNGEFDILINASGSGQALAQCVDHAGLEATIVEASWYGERSVTLPLGGAFHSRRLRLISSQVGHVSPLQRPRWTYARRLHKALELLCDDRLNVLISGETAFDDLPQDYGRILTNPSTLCHRIRY